MRGWRSVEVRGSARESSTRISVQPYNCATNPQQPPGVVRKYWNYQGLLLSDQAHRIAAVRQPVSQVLFFFVG